ncbi:hypothetical protein CKM354_001137400 [Cercospora kikuchii]|uniref:Cupin type-1 domain-containing protein n=1 Tax=Cercospora kikuchii TaxID=84275 RepID=A0A9P3CVE7_9PEZI|nr:uncharacterized protein CKM354_001137400 [Cercospora kikuchii]GIZ48307.1 hypothetical protein CKM354_001137400 [Cercospora kikuchii]
MKPIQALAALLPTLLRASPVHNDAESDISRLPQPAQFARNLHDENFNFKEGSKHLRPVRERRQDDTTPGYFQGQPNNGMGKGGRFNGGTNEALDLQNPNNLGAPNRDAGNVVNLKFSFSNARTRTYNGGWVREQAISDLPPSKDIAGAQLSLDKGSIREFHWHRVAEWGYVYKGRIAVTAVDNMGRNQYSVASTGDVWYFPEGEGHALQGLDDENEFLLCFDDGDFGRLGTTFNLDDWLAKTPRDVLAKNFGLDISVFDAVPVPNPYIQNATVSEEDIDHPFGELEGESSYVYKSSQQPAIEAPGGGGTYKNIDTEVFPISKTISAAVVELKPGAMRELHWHPNAEEWLYFHQGQARATVFLGNSAARTFDFVAGDTAVMPDNAGHYIENTSQNETLVWIEVYKADRVLDNSLQQWLALTPAPIVASVLRIPVDVVRNMKKEKQVLIAA